MTTCHLILSYYKLEEFNFVLKQLPNGTRSKMNLSRTSLIASVLVYS